MFSKSPLSISRCTFTVMVVSVRLETLARISMVSPCRRNRGMRGCTISSFCAWMVRLRVPTWNWSVHAKPYNCHWVRTLLVAAQGRLEEGKGAEVLAHGRGHIGGSATEVKLGGYLGNGLFGYIHAGALAHTTLHRNHAVFATGIPHAADRGNDTLNTGAGHVGDVVGGHTGTGFGSAYLNDVNIALKYLDFFQFRCGRRHRDVQHPHTITGNGDALFQFPVSDGGGDKGVFACGHSP